MKCQKCGTNESNFHHSRNIDGNVTETHLCAQCAMELGYDVEQMFNQNQFMDLGNILGGMFAIGNGNSGFMPQGIPATQAKAIPSLIMFPMMGMNEQPAGCGCGCGSSTAPGQNIEVDEEMKARRELNAQMRLAVDNEDFEKAAQIRDKIKEIEAGGIQKCDSETTTSQDSQDVQ